MKKRIGILTYYNVHNHGALLQMYGLKNSICNFSDEFEVEHLKFDRDYSYISESQKRKYKIGFKSIGIYTKLLLSKGLGFIFFHLEKEKIFKRFLKNNFVIENYVYNYKDNIIVGSDEVFSAEIGYNKFMYGVDLNAVSIQSYAASFGSTTYQELKDKELLKDIETGLQNITCISVRDKNSEEIIKKILPSNNVEMVCDPVILYGFNKEIKTIDLKKKFLLLYSYDKNTNTKEEIQQIRSFAKSLNLPIYSVGFYHKWADKNINADPIECLNYFNSAEYVITDTFHGAVMSIITNKQFSVLLRNNSNKLKFLLDQYNLSNRILTDFSGLSKMSNEKIDFAKVNESIEKDREKSFKVLEKILNGCK